MLTRKQFDDLQPGSSLPTAYPIPGISWSNWQVLNASTLEAQTGNGPEPILSAPSPPNVIQAPSSGSILFDYNGDYSDDYSGFALQSFDFSCDQGHTYPGGAYSVFDATCEIIVVLSQDSGVYGQTQDIQDGGTFAFSAGACGDTCNMTSVTAAQLPSFFGQRVDFYIVQGYSTGHLLLDNIVLATQRPFGQC